MPLQKSSGVAILVSLQECGFFQPRTVHSETNSEKPQVKIRFAFHFVERNDLCDYFASPLLVENTN